MNHIIFFMVIHGPLHGHYMLEHKSDINLNINTTEERGKGVVEFYIENNNSQKLIQKFLALGEKVFFWNVNLT